MVQTRGAFVGLIHAKCLAIRDGVYDDAAAVTHMGNDVDTIDYLPWLFQEIWAQVLELCIGMVLLWREIGWWCLTPIVIVVCEYGRQSRWQNCSVSEIHSMLTCSWQCVPDHPELLAVALVAQL